MRPREFGIWENNCLMEYTADFKQMFGKCYNDIVRALMGMMNVYRRDYLNRDDDKIIKTVDMMTLIRQLRFMMIGALAMGMKPKVKLFQFIISKLSYDIIKRGSFYEDEDKNWYDKSSIEEIVIYDTLVIGGKMSGNYKYIRGVREYGTVLNSL